MSGPELPPAVPSSVLRVYEPLEAFAVADRTALQAIALRPDANLRADRVERLAAWRSVLRPGAPWGPGGRFDQGGQALPAGAVAGTDGRPAVRVLHRAGVLLVCPVAPPPPTARPQGPGAMARESRRPGRHRQGDVGSWLSPAPEEARRPGSEPAQEPQHPHRSLVRAWQLPIPWLALARREDDGGGGRYVVPMSAARTRSARALRTLRTGLGDVDVTVEVEVLARWLESYHPRSAVELDVSSLRPLVGDDDGVDDVRLGLECLACGDSTGNAASYHRLLRRSQVLDDLARSS